MTKNLKLSERKRNRLKAKAKSLSSQDLLEVLQFRSVNQEKMAAAKRARATETAQLCRFNLERRCLMWSKMRKFHRWLHMYCHLHNDRHLIFKCRSKSLRAF